MHFVQAVNHKIKAVDNTVNLLVSQLHNIRTCKMTHTHGKHITALRPHTQLTTQHASHTYYTEVCNIQFLYTPHIHSTHYTVTYMHTTHIRITQHSLHTYVPYTHTNTSLAHFYRFGFELNSMSQQPLVAHSVQLDTHR